ncbi:MAG: hypothetical protein DRO76_01255 [Candidatus Altiarchaeales archaeon]|nr:MAG: hypothetical protein DRO76_01255 [Candidatus Altiarchaeales archaeon]HDI72955.1 hypothetical protein [Candidatus Altiarchaeales archaeon]
MDIGDQPVGVMILAGLLVLCVIFPILEIIHVAGEKNPVDMIVNTDFSSLFHFIFLMSFIPIQLALALGLWLLKSWGRTGTIIFSIVVGIMFLIRFDLIGFIGVIVSAIVIWYLLREDVGEAFER